MLLKKIVLSAVMTMTVAVLPGIIYGQAYGTAATQTLNIRKEPSTNVKILEQVSLGTPIEIVKKADKNGWLQIRLKDDTTGYVSQEYVSIHRVVATVNGTGVRVRDYPSLNDSKIMGQFAGGEEISAHYKVGDWYKISQEGFEGFVHADYVEGSLLESLPVKNISQVQRVKETQQQVNNEGKVYASNNKKPQQKSSSLGDAIVAYAKQFLGSPYVYGGNSLTSGVDCSGFTQQIMKKFGVYLSRSSSAQYNNDGYHVSVDELKKGDLVYYGYKGRVSHAAIYIGGGQVIHANDERTGVIISSLYPTNGKPLIGAKRVI